ncbi:hypothetical protein ABIF68_003996 [Bradyrhizobium japonicum]|jgi:putative DNA primase/helicase|nr:hypothetical protein [Bradyrhizobium japonicum]
MVNNIFKLAALQDAEGPPASSEDALALVYAERHAADSQYIAASGRWFVFDGSRWRVDDTLQAFDRARVSCREFAPQCTKPAAAASARTPRRHRQFRKFALGSRPWSAQISKSSQGGEQELLQQPLPSFTPVPP